MSELAKDSFSDDEPDVEVNEQLEELDRMRGWLFSSTEEYVLSPNSTTYTRFVVAAHVLTVEFSKTLDLLLATDQPNTRKLAMIDHLLELEDGSRVEVFNSLIEEDYLLPAEQPLAVVNVDGQPARSMGEAFDEIYMDEDCLTGLKDASMNAFAACLQWDVQKIVEYVRR